MTEPRDAQPSQPESEKADLAAQTLAAVRDASVVAGRAQQRKSSVSRAARGKSPWVGEPANRAHASGPRPDDRDPKLVGDSVERLVHDLGWSERAAVAGVIGRWPDIAGPELASHVTPESFDDHSGLLQLRADATAWATQTRFLVPKLQRRLDDEIGPGIVRRIEVAGPASPRRNPGPLRVQGRGPRDTYG